MQRTMADDNKDGGFRGRWLQTMAEVAVHGDDEEYTAFVNIPASTVNPVQK